MAIKLAFLLSHPIQYFSPLFRELTKNAGIDLTVLYSSRHGLESRVDEKFGVEFAWDIPLLEGYKYKFLESIPRGASPQGPLGLFNPGIVRELFAEHYEVLVVHGYNYLTCWLAFLGAKATSTKLLVRGESHLLAKRPFWRRAFKALPLKVLFRTLDGYLAIGSRSARYAEHCGVRANRVFIAPYCVHNEFFAKRAKEGAGFREKMLRALNLHPGSIVLAFFGKLYPRKAPFDLLVAFEKLNSERVALLFVGDGESRRPLEDYVARKHISNVRFTGFVNQSMLPKYYGLTDVVVLPSRAESWGLVVNEAMACACAVVVSDVCGCAPDLVHEGKNGCIFPAGNVEALSKILRQLVNDPQCIRAMGRASEEIITDWSPQVSAARIADAVANVVLKKEGLRQDASFATRPKKRKQGSRLQKSFRQKI